MPAFFNESAIYQFRCELQITFFSSSFVCRIVTLVTTSSWNRRPTRSCHKIPLTREIAVDITHSHHKRNIHSLCTTHSTKSSIAVVVWAIHRVDQRLDWTPCPQAVYPSFRIKHKGHRWRIVNGFTHRCVLISCW